MSQQCLCILPVDVTRIFWNSRRVSVMRRRARHCVRAPSMADNKITRFAMLFPGTCTGNLPVTIRAAIHYPYERHCP